MVLTASILFPTLARKATALELTSRGIEMSSSAPSATSVTYKVFFTVAQSALIKAVVVDFCGNGGTPLIGDSSCPAPAGMSLSGLGVNTTSGHMTGLDTTNGSWTTTTLNSGRTAAIENAGATTSTTTGTSVSFELTGITNQSGADCTTSNCTFYARLLTFNTATPTYTATTGPTAAGVLDSGGAALTTVVLISITAKVEETLTFCVSGGFNNTTNAVNPFTDSGNTNKDCTPSDTEISTPTLNLGHDNGSGTIILDSSQVDATAAYTQVSTNAASGVVVRMKAGNTCAEAGLSATGGSDCSKISGVGQIIDNTHATQFDSGTTGEGQIVANTAEFGLCVHPEDANTAAFEPYADSHSGAGACVPATFTTKNVAPANATTYFGMDNSTNVSDTDSVTSTYGGRIFTSTGPVNKANDSLVFAATASLTTPAGIYQGSEALIATGTF